MDIPKQTTRQILLRLGLFMLLMNIMSWLDRANVGFAALHMNEELGFDPKTFGMGVGIFSITSTLCQVPMSEAIARFGCRRALATMMIVWGTLAASMGLIQDSAHFFTIRVLLGAAESGVGPLTLLYASRWVPQKAIASYMVWIVLSAPLGAVLGAPISALLISATEGMGGLSGWRWMFLLEGAPAILLGVIALYWLTERPEEARWLAPERKAWLIGQLKADAAGGAEGHAAAAGGLHNLKWILRDPTVWRFTIALFCMTSGLLGLLYWMPQMLHELTAGADGVRSVLLSTVPWVGAIVGMILSARLSDWSGKRLPFFAGGLILGSLSLVASFNLGGGMTTLAFMTLALFGIGGAMSTVWTVPMAHLRGREGSGLAMTVVNLLGFSSGLIIPIVIGRIQQATGGLTAVLWFLAGMLALGALVAVFGPRPRGPVIVPAAQPAGA